LLSPHFAHGGDDNKTNEEDCLHWLDFFLNFLTANTVGYSLTSLRVPTADAVGYILAPLRAELFLLLPYGLQPVA
jgi:hypothetical protein